MINFNKLERAAKRKGMTIGQACKKVNINRVTYWRWRTGLSMPRDLRVRGKLCNKKLDKLLNVLDLKSA